MMKTDDIIIPLDANDLVASAAIQQLTEEQLLVEHQKRLLEQQEKSSYFAIEKNQLMEHWLRIRTRGRIE